MKAFLLAAGKGKRLLPFTEDNPKPLVKVGGISLIERIIKILKNTNIQEIVINLHHRGEKIVNLLGDGSDYGLKISYSLEKELLGTGGGIQNAIHHFEEPFFVLSSDIWTEFDFNNLELKDDFLAHMILIPNPESNLKGDVSLIDGYVRSDLEENKYTFSGIMIISPDLFSLSKVGPLQLWNDILKPASLNNLVSGEIFKGRYENLNTLEDVERLDGLLSEE